MYNSLIIERNKEKRLQKEQVRFNKHIKQIEKLRAQIHITDNNLQTARLIYDVILQPLIDKWVLLKVKRLRLLDELASAIQNSEIDARQIKYLLIEEATELADKYNHREAQQIFDKYSFRSFDEMRRESFTDLLQRSKELLRQIASDDKNDEEETAAETTSEVQAHPQQKMVLLKKMYMNLVRSFHPDKNNHQKSQAESVTKKANEAYQKKSFYDLLILDLTYINKNEDYLPQLPKEELKLLNEGLEGEVTELTSLLRSVQNKYGPFFYQKYGYSGNKLKAIIQKEKIALTYRLQQMEHNWNLCGDEVKMKEFLVRNEYSFTE